MIQFILALGTGIIFGLGLAISQMINPNKVLNFLDVAGSWDPSLALVMAGALTVTIVGFRWVQKRAKPVLDDRFHITHNIMIDKPLLVGAALFGVGWGMTGYCPGPAVAGLAIGNREAFLMVAGIYAGFWAAGLLLRRN